MPLNISKTVGKEKKLKWEIVKVLIANNPGYDFGVNPKEVSNEMSLAGFDATPIETGNALKQMGFREKSVSGKVYRKIYVGLLKKLENEMIGEDEREIEKVKPILVNLYHRGYNSTDNGSRKIHDKIAEPVRQKIGKWYCQTPIKEIEEYLEKCKAEGLIPKDVK